MSHYKNSEMQLFPTDHLDRETPKLYYSIGEVSQMFKVNTSLIRFWEREFEILRPKKNAKGNRLFTPEDVENLKIIFHLVKERGFTLDGAKKRMRENKNDVEHNVKIAESLKKIRRFLEELKDQI
jgi:DNA-binding transcriptional MerR regulator